MVSPGSPDHTADMKSRIITCICAEENNFSTFRRGFLFLLYKQAYLQNTGFNCQSRLHEKNLLHRHRLKQHHGGQHCKDQCNCDLEYPDQNFFSLLSSNNFFYGTRKRFFLQFCNFGMLRTAALFLFISSVAHIYSIRVIIACPASGSKTHFFISGQILYYLITYPEKEKEKIIKKMLPKTVITAICAANVTVRIHFVHESTSRNITSEQQPAIFD